MKRTFRKAIACLLAVLMVLTAAPLSALARDQVNGENVGWWGDSNFDATKNPTLYALVNSNGSPIEPEFETIVKEFEFGWADAYEVADTEVEDPEADLLDQMKPTITVTVTNMGNSVAGDFTTETGVTTTTRKYFYGETNKTLASMPATGVGSLLNPADLKAGQRIAVTFEIGGIDANYATQIKGVADPDYLTFGAYSATRKWATYTTGTSAAPFVGNFYSNYGDAASNGGSAICDCPTGQFYTPFASNTPVPQSAYTGPEVRTVGEHGMLVCSIEFEVKQDCDLADVLHLDQSKDNDAAWKNTEIIPYDETAAGGGYFTFDTEDTLHTAGLIALNYTAYDAGSGPQPTTQYTVTFEDYAGNTVSSTPYDENTAAADVTVPANTASDAQYTYAWPTIADVTEDVTYKETRTVNEYPIAFVNYAGDTVQSTNVAYGSTPTAPANTASDAQYTYAWPTLSAVTGAATYNETRTVNQYTITFVNAAGTTVDTQTLDYGATPVAPANTATDVGQAITTTYSWPAISAVTGDATYTEVANSTATEYTVTFTNYAGTVVDTQTLAYGATPVAPANTASDAQYTYAWPTVSDVSGDANYDETRTVNQYTVTWDFADDRPNQVDTYEYGATPVAPQNSSVKVGNVTTTYKWEGVADVTGDATYTEVVDQQITDAFTVTFKTYGGTEYTKDYQAGTEASVLAADAANYSTASDAQYTYAWPEFAAVTADATYTETRTVNEYPITFVNYAGDTVQSTNVAYGSTPTAPANTASDAQYTYAWPTVSAVTGAATYNETRTVNNYTVTWKFADGRPDLEETYAYGATPTAPANSVITSGYTTTTYKWEGVTDVTGNATYTEVVDSAETTQFTVTFVNAAGVTVSEAQYDGGTVAANVTVPANTANTKRTTYAWPAVADVTENVTYNEVVTDLGYTVAVTPSTLGTVTINGEEVASKNVPLNSTVTLVATPANDNVEFIGWKTGAGTVSTNATFSTVVVADVEYTPVFAEKSTEFTVVFVDKFGNVVDAQTVDSGADIVVPAAPALTGYVAATDNGWDMTNDEIAALDAAATVTAVYEKDEAAATYTVTADGATITYKGEAKENSYAELPYDAKVTLTAEGATVWKVDGTAVAYGDSYTFYVGANVTVTYETDTAVVATPAITGISVGEVGSAGSIQATFLAAFSLGDAKFVKAGYIYGKACDPESTLDDVDGTNVKALYVNASPTQYQLNYGYRAQTGTITAIAFLVYKQGNSANTVIYAAPQTYTYA